MCTGIPLSLPVLQPAWRRAVECHPKLSGCPQSAASALRPVEGTCRRAGADLDVCRVPADSIPKPRRTSHATEIGSRRSASSTCRSWQVISHEQLTSSGHLRSSVNDAPVPKQPDTAQSSLAILPSSYVAFRPGEPARPRPRSNVRFGPLQWPPFSLMDRVLLLGRETCVPPKTLPCDRNLCLCRSPSPTTRG